MRIIVDAFGGDNAPLEILKGAVAAKNEFGCDILLCGDEEQIRQRIDAGHWPLGQRLPPEPELAELLGMSRNTVREAVRVLNVLAQQHGGVKFDFQELDL